MNITHDEPGRLLTLEGDAPGLPGGMVGGLLGGIVEGLATAAGGSDVLWQAVRVCADREAGSLEIVEKSLVSGENRSETIPLARIGGVSVRIRIWRPSSTTKRAPAAPGSRGVELTLSIVDPPTPRTRSLWMRVEGIDSREEVADFAYRLGAAIGLSHQSVVHSDPRRMEILMTSGPGLEAEPMPAVESRADYARNTVIPAATKAATEEIVQPFEPAQFLSRYKVLEWLPGNDIRFRKPFDSTALGCLPVILVGILAGPAFSAMGARLDTTMLAVVFGLLVAGFAASFVVSSMPRNVVISWQKRTIRAGGLFAYWPIPFDRLAALELRCVRTPGGRRQTSVGYQCHVFAHRKGSAKPVELVCTNYFQNDSETPYDQALPLVTELASALSVERRVTDYD